MDHDCKLAVLKKWSPQSNRAPLGCVRKGVLHQASRSEGVTQEIEGVFDEREKTPAFCYVVVCFVDPITPKYAM